MWAINSRAGHPPTASPPIIYAPHHYLYQVPTMGLQHALLNSLFITLSSKLPRKLNICLNILYRSNIALMQNLLPQPLPYPTSPPSSISTFQPYLHIHREAGFISYSYATVSPRKSSDTPCSWRSAAPALRLQPILAAEGEVGHCPVLSHPT